MTAFESVTGTQSVICAADKGQLQQSRGDLPVLCQFVAYSKGGGILHLDTTAANGLQAVLDRASRNEAIARRDLRRFKREVMYIVHELSHSPEVSGTTKVHDMRALDQLENGFHLGEAFAQLCAELNADEVSRLAGVLLLDERMATIELPAVDHPYQNQTHFLRGVITALAERTGKSVAEVFAPVHASGAGHQSLLALGIALTSVAGQHDWTSGAAANCILRGLEAPALLYEYGNTQGWEDTSWALGHDLGVRIILNEHVDNAVAFQLAKQMRDHIATHRLFPTIHVGNATSSRQAGGPE